MIVYPQDKQVVPGLIGGKGFNLAELTRAGQPVPAWYAISAALMDRVFSENHLWKEINKPLACLSVRNGPQDIARSLEPVQALIRRSEFSSQIRNIIRNSHQKMIGENFFSVRSSAIDEDSAGASFAGLHDSFLFINGEEDLFKKIKDVWASAYNPRAVSFRLHNSIPFKNIRMAVIVQQMVDAKISGIMFTANPNNNNVQEILISSLYGTGEGIVSAGLDADLFICSKENDGIKETIATKSEQFVFDRQTGKGLKKIAIAREDQEKASLSREQILEIAKIGLAVERYFHKPQDIEFSIDQQKQLFILQARPITTIPEYRPAAGNRLVWDNSNIIESYSGPTSPMTFSFIRHAYTIVYHCFAQVMGITPEAVHKNRYVFENMLGLLRGQVYYNLMNWYRLIRLFPGFSYNKTFMESMMGVREEIDLTNEGKDAPIGFFKKYFIEFPKLIRLLARSIINFIRIETLVKEFEASFEKHYQKWAAMDFKKLPPHELMEIYREMESKLLWNWKTPIINDFYVMIFYGSLKRRCLYWCRDDNGSLQNDLICGEGDIESTKPTKLLMEIARIVKSNPSFLKFFNEKLPEELASSVPQMENFRPISEKIAYYLEHYGFRCINELKLEEPSLRETPEFLYQMIQNYIRMDNDEALNPDIMEEREQRIRREAEKKAGTALSKGIASIPKKIIFALVLRNARQGVKNRENMRFARTKIYGMIKELLNALGSWFAKEGIIETSKDIYFLTMDEVWDYIKGTAVTTGLKGLIELRKSEFGGYRSADAPKPADHFETFGMAYHRNLFQNPRFSTTVNKDGFLQGTGCCPGTVTAVIKIVKSPKDNLKLNKEILVAERTDPGWVPLYPSVSGILIERGSILSHSAIVAREMGIPTIVGIPDLMVTLKEGQKVQMDGHTGIVKIMD